MAQTIKLKRSSTSGATPTTSQLELGEVAINTYDGKMFIKKNDGSDSIVEIGGSSASSEITKTFTATGSISAGDPVSIKSDGTVTKVGASSSTAASTGSTVFFNAPNDANGGLRDSGEIKVAYDGSGYAIATGIDDGDGDKPFFQVFSVSGTTLTAIGSSSTKINDLDVEFPPAIVYDSSISKFIVYGRRVPTGEVGQSHAHYITLDSNGSATVSSGFYSSASHDLAGYPANLLSLGDGRQVIYGSDSSNDIFVQLLTTNGTTMTWGDELMITSTGQNREPSAALTTDGKMVIVWRSGNPDDLLGVVVTPPTSPSTTMSAGTVVTIADGDPNYQIVAGSVSSGGKVIAYGRPNTDNPSFYYRAYVADVSGTGFGSFTMTDNLNAIDKGVIIWDDTKSKFYFFGQSPNTSDKLVRREVTIDSSNGVSLSAEVILDNSNIVEDTRVEGISCGNGLFLIAFYEDQGSESLQSGNLILRQESVSGAGAPVADYIGINKTTVTDGNTATVVLAGAVTTSGTLTRGSEVFLTDAGAYTNTDNGNRRIGEAITTTDIVLSPLGGIPGNVTTTAAELNILDGATVTTDELNILDGVTATTAELNILDGVTSTATELNLLDGVTATTAELNYVDGVTSNIQTQLDAKGTVSSLSDLSITATASELNLLDGVTATTAELNYIDGVTSNIQTQLDAKAPLASPTFTGTVTAPTLNVSGNLTVSGTTTTLNTATLDVEDKNITLNFGSGDTSASADGAGITIQDAVDASTDATILWDATNDEFDFSHPINASGATFTGNLALGDTVKIQIGDEPNLEIYHNGSHSFIEDIGGGSLFLKGGPQLKLMNDGETAVLCQKDSHVKLYYDNSEKLSTASTGITVTGTLTIDGNTAWHAGNDGSGSGLDADTVDGVQASQFLRSDATDSASGALSFSGGLAITDGPGTIAGATFDNGWFRLGSSGAGISIDSNEMYISGSGNFNVGALGSGVWNFLTRPRFTTGIDFGDSSPTIDENGNYVRIQTSSGYTDIGANNTSYSHFYTDRGKFYFNRQLTVDSGVVSSYDEDLILRRADSTVDRIQLADGYTDFGNQIRVKEGTTDCGLRFMASAGNDFTFTSNSSAGGSNIFVKVGDDLSTATNEFYFDYQGNFHADGNITAYSTTINSDSRLKDNIENIEAPLEKLNGIRGVTWNWKKDGKEGAGVVAQEVEKVFPQAVSETKCLNTEEIQKVVDYNQIIGLLVESVKELKAEIDELKGAK